MRFLALTPSNALALLGGVAALIFLFYLLKPRVRRVVVGSNLIWNRVLAQSKTVSQRWRWLFSLLLATLIGLAMALALTQPEVRALGGEAKRIVLVLDNAPSMSARTKDGSSRFRRAQALARELIANAGVASQFLVTDTMGFAGAPGYADRASALAQIDKLPVAVSGRARFPALPSGSDINAKLERYLISDGVAEFAVPNEVIVRSVFEAADNVALLAFEARALPNDPTRYQAFLQIFNASPAAQRVVLQVSAAANAFAASRTVDIEAGATSDQIVDVSAFEGGVLRASVRAPGDAFGIDDEAYAVVHAHQAVRVLLVTNGNVHLQDALKLLPGVRVTTVAPGKYGAQANYDVAVFDRFAPNAPPAMPALLFRPPKTAWLPDPGAAASKPVITKWDQDNPLAAGLSWKDLQIERAMLAQVPADGAGDQQALVLARGSGEGALVLASAGELRWLRVGFALEDSNLPFQADFPVFLGSVLRWLSAANPVETRSIGPIEVSAREALVSDIDGKRVQSVASGARTVFAASRPNVYAIKSAGREFQLVANVTDPGFADINNSRLADASPSPKPAQAARRSAWHPWMLLVLLAVVLVALETLLYHRRVTL